MIYRLLCFYKLNEYQDICCETYENIPTNSKANNTCSVNTGSTDAVRFSHQLPIYNVRHPPCFISLHPTLVQVAHTGQEINLGIVKNRNIKKLTITNYFNWTGNHSQAVNSRLKVCCHHSPGQSIVTPWVTIYPSPPLQPRIIMNWVFIIISVPNLELWTENSEAYLQRNVQLAGLEHQELKKLNILNHEKIHSNY